MSTVSANIFHAAKNHVTDASRQFIADINNALGAKNPNKMDPVCLFRHCALKIPAAMIEPKMIKLATCENGCNEFYYNDTTEGKLLFQNCTTKCSLTYESKAGDELMSCAMENNCITFAPIDVTCPVEALTAAVEPGSSMASLNGEWW